MINKIFDLCVDLLIVWARWFGITYKEINVWIFCVLWPLATLGMGVVIVYQQGKIQALKSLVERSHLVQAAPASAHTTLKP